MQSTVDSWASCAEVLPSSTARTIYGYHYARHHPAFLKSGTKRARQSHFHSLYDHLGPISSRYVTFAIFYRHEKKVQNPWTFQVCFMESEMAKLKVFDNGSTYCWSVFVGFPNQTKVRQIFGQRPKQFGSPELSQIFVYFLILIYPRQRESVFSQTGSLQKSKDKWWAHRFTGVWSAKESNTRAFNRRMSFSQVDARVSDPHTAKTSGVFDCARVLPTGFRRFPSQLVFIKHWSITMAYV